MSDGNTPTEGPPAQTSVASPPTDPPEDSNVVVLPPEAVREAAERGTGLRVTIVTAHSGPLPSPATLREYNEVIPGLSQTIVSEFQREANHRRRSQTIGALGAICIALAAILAGTVLGYVLKSPLAAFAVIGPVCGVVGTAQLLEFWFKSKG